MEEEEEGCQTPKGSAELRHHCHHRPLQLHPREQADRVEVLVEQATRESWQLRKSSPRERWQLRQSFPKSKQVPDQEQSRWVRKTL